MTDYIYRTQTYSDKITRYELVSKTEKTVNYIVRSPLIGGAVKLVVRRAMLRSKHDKFHETWEDARSHLVQSTARDIEAKLSMLNKANATLDKLVALTEPKEWA
jgi:hypothetical protein